MSPLVTVLVAWFSVSAIVSPFVGRMLAAANPEPALVPARLRDRRS
jgi:hypothetical protein